MEPLAEFDIDNILSLSAHNAARARLNALTKLQVKEGADGPKFTFSDGNAIITIPKRQVAATQTTIGNLPWQISQITQTGAANDWRTVRVSSGTAWLAYTTSHRTFTAASPDSNLFGTSSINNSTGTDADIVVASGEVWAFWVKVEPASPYVAALEYSNTYPPAGWHEFPNTQAYTPHDTLRGDVNGYSLVGFADAATDAATQQLHIRQRVYGHIEIPFAQPVTATFDGGWSALGHYPYLSVVTKGDKLYVRYNLANGENGGDPAGGNDWSELGDFTA